MPGARLAVLPWPMRYRDIVQSLQESPAPWHTALGGVVLGSLLVGLVGLRMLGAKLIHTLAPSSPAK